MTKAISLKKCRFSYDNNSELVINIDQLEIEAGEKVFLYGPSGHGKSTLLNLTAGVLKANSGLVEVLGEDLTKIGQSRRDHMRGEKIGYIFQIFNLIPYLTVK
jgi:putative ABC transport system ATP-binding protein